MNRVLVLGVVVLLLAATSRATAQGTPKQEALVVTAENLMAGDERHQAWAAKGGAATDVLPGDVIRYLLRFTNTTAQPVQNVVFSNPVPAGLRYVAGSATAEAAGTSVTFSLDGGRSYSAQPMIEVVENGERRNVPAPPAMYTHVRWTVSGWVQPGAAVVSQFRAELVAPRDSTPQ
jgi:uncharacterized repeat protein (TIGR01451 family)